MAKAKSNTALDSINENAPSRATSGVYQIRNLLNGNRYVGSSRGVRERWRLHYWLLEDRSNHCRYLQNAWRKYGREAFVFEIVELVDDMTRLREREQFYIDTWRPRYNASPSATGGGPWTENSKAKMRKRKSPQTVKRMREGAKRSYEIDPQLRQSRIDNFRRYRETHPEYNRGPNNGFYGKSPNRELLMSPEVQAKRTASLRRTYGEGKAKLRFRPVFQLTREGDLIKRWPSIIEAAKAVGVSAGFIGNVCRGRDKTAGGSRWEYAGERA